METFNRISLAQNLICLPILLEASKSGCHQEPDGFLQCQPDRWEDVVAPCPQVQPGQGQVLVSSRHACGGTHTQSRPHQPARTKSIAFAGTRTNVNSKGGLSPARCGCSGLKPVSEVRREATRGSPGQPAQCLAPELVQLMVPGPTSP